MLSGLAVSPASPTEVSRALFHSLLHCPLLVDELPEASSLFRVGLTLPPENTTLNLEQKLGHLYEDALSAIFEFSLRYDLVGRNVQVRNQSQQTLGEFDFLIYDLSENELIHLELATKFYLAVDTADGMTYPGPDARDNLGKKIEHLRTHQLVLSRNENALTLLRSNGYSTFCSPKHLIYGCLFDHINAKILSRPEHVSPFCRRGRWLRSTECPAHVPQDTEVRLIPKPLWPIPISDSQDLLPPPIPLSETLQLAEERCIMVAVGNSRTPHFITPPNYPA